MDQSLATDEPGVNKQRTDCPTSPIVRALETGRLAGNAGEVWFPQPAPKDHPWRTMPGTGAHSYSTGDTTRGSEEATRFKKTARAL